MITHSRLHKLLFYKITMYLTALNDDSKYITAAQISALKIFFWTNFKKLSPYYSQKSITIKELKLVNAQQL